MATNYGETLSVMTGKVDMMRRGLPPSLIQSLLNDRIRQTLDRRPYWADLIVKGIIAIPDGYVTGTTAFTSGSPVVAGVGTSWPVDDVVSSNIPSGIDDYGFQEVQPAQMTGITNDSLLYVDDGGTPETVAVVQVTPYSFFANFANLHNENCTITQSSLANRQFRTGSTYPIFTVRSVQADNELTLDSPWGGASLAPGQPYQILKMYFTLIPNLKEIMWVLDQDQGIAIDVHIPVKNINYRDPQRQSTGNPIALVDFGTNDNGLSLYELWPAQNTARQLQFAAYQQWAPLINANDRPPWFLNPAIFVYGALADACRYKRAADDPFHNIMLAREYDAKYETLVEAAIQANDSKLQSSYTYPMDSFGFPGGNYGVRHEPDKCRVNF